MTSPFERARVSVYRVGGSREPVRQREHVGNCEYVRGRRLISERKICVLKVNIQQLGG